MAKKTLRGSWNANLIKSHDKLEEYESKLFKKYGEGWETKNNARERSKRFRLDSEISGHPKQKKKK